MNLEAPSGFEPEMEVLQFCGRLGNARQFASMLRMFDFRLSPGSTK
jgi:hypothetical protein